MAALDGQVEGWAVSMLEEKLTPQGAAALGVVLQQGKVDLDAAIGRVHTEIRRLELMVVLPLSLALLAMVAGLLTKLFLG